MPQLTSDRKQVEGLSPYKPTIRVNRKVRVKALGLYLRPRTVGIGFLALVAAGYILMRLGGIGGA